MARYLRKVIRARLDRHASELKKAMRKSNRDTDYTRSVGYIVRTEEETEMGNSMLSMQAVMPYESTVRGIKESGAEFKKVSRKKRVTDALFKSVDERLENHERKERQGKLFQKVEVLKKSLTAIAEGNQDGVSRLYKPKRSALNMFEQNQLALSQEKLKAYQTDLEEKAVAKEVSKINSANLMSNDYMSGVSIYYGAVIAFQAKHGGYLRYNTITDGEPNKQDKKELDASAPRIGHQSKLIVKNSENLTSTGEMQYGDALWLETANGSNDVVGGTFGKLVDKQRKMQPGLICCKRENMYKAKQYGRWIILNKDDPMGTVGKQVKSLDNIILEQEWYFLCSQHPNECSMVKMLNNSDEAMTTKIDLFRPKEECWWSLQLVELPAKDKATEKMLYRLLGEAHQKIADSKNLRRDKAANLLTCLDAKMDPALSATSVMINKLEHKRTIAASNKHMDSLYMDLSKNGFEKLRNPVKFLEHVYGTDAGVTQINREIMHRKGLEWKIENFKAAKVKDVPTRTKTDVAEEEYWTHAQHLMVDNRAYLQISGAMAGYYDADHERKYKAAILLQRAVRRYIEGHFDYERSMKRVDRENKEQLEEKTAMRRKLIASHMATASILNKHINSASTLTVANGTLKNGTQSRQPNRSSPARGPEFTEQVVGGDLDGAGYDFTRSFLQWGSPSDSQVLDNHGSSIADDWQTGKQTTGTSSSLLDLQRGMGMGTGVRVGMGVSMAQPGVVMVARSSAETFFTVNRTVDSSGVPHELKRNANMNPKFKIFAAPDRSISRGLSPQRALPTEFRLRDQSQNPVRDNRPIHAVAAPHEVVNFVPKPSETEPQLPFDTRDQPSSRYNLLSDSGADERLAHHSSFEEPPRATRPKTASMAVAASSSSSSGAAGNLENNRPFDEARRARPSTGQARPKTGISDRVAGARLGQSLENRFGLPLDVFEDCQVKPSADTGIKFLRSIRPTSSGHSGSGAAWAHTKNNIYADLNVRNKSRAKSSGR